MTDLIPSNDDGAIRDYLDLTVSANLRAHQLAAARAGWPTNDLEAVAVLDSFGVLIEQDAQHVVGRTFPASECGLTVADDVIKSPESHHHERDKASKSTSEGLSDGTECVIEGVLHRAR